MTKTETMSKTSKTSKIVTITPEQAAKMLETNQRNRNVSKNAVTAMARDMSAGHWRMNGDAIRIDSEGNLIDGQHRLTASVLSGESFQTILVTGLDTEDQLTIDRGRPRSIGDNLSIAYGVQSGKLVAATIRNLVMFANQDLGAYPTVTEYKEILDLHPRIVESAMYSLNSPPARPALLAAIHYVGAHVQKQPERADAFVQVFKTGIPNYKGDAAHALREMLIREKSRGVRRADFKNFSLFANMWDKFCFKVPVRSARSKDDFKLRGWDGHTLYQPMRD